MGKKMIQCFYVFCFTIMAGCVDNITDNNDVTHSSSQSNEYNKMSTRSSDTNNFSPVQNLSISFIDSLVSNSIPIRLTNRHTGKTMTNQNLSYPDMTTFLFAYTTVPEEWWSAQWCLEKKDSSFYRIRNRWKDTYINNQADVDVLKVTELGHESWWSAQWSISIIDNKYCQFNNRWKPGELINQERNGLSVGCNNNSQPDWWSAQWIIEIM